MKRGTGLVEWCWNVSQFQWDVEPHPGSDSYLLAEQALGTAFGLSRYDLFGNHSLLCAQQALS